jgi:hypothetical protein
MKELQLRETVFSTSLDIYTRVWNGSDSPDLTDSDFFYNYILFDE